MTQIKSFLLRLTQHKILGNALWLLSAQSLIKLISFVYTIFLARNLGVDNFGLYVTALAYFSLVSSVADFGINRFLIREISTNKKGLNCLLSSTILFRLSLLSLLFALFAALFYLFDPDRLRGTLATLAILAALPQAVSLSLDSCFIALLKAKYSAIGLLVLSISTALLGVVLVTGGLGVMGATVALIIGQLIYSLTTLFASFWQRIDFLGAVDREMIKRLIRGSVPYGLLGILGLLYFKIDALLLSYLRGNFDAGVYGAAYRFLEAIVFVPTAFSASLFPILAQLHQENRSKIKQIYFRFLKILFVLSIPITLLFYFILPIIIHLVLPLYRESIDALKILSLAIPFLFTHVVAATVLLSTDRYLKAVTKLSIITLSFNVILNLILIPYYGYIGAAWTTVFSEILSFSVFFIYLKRVLL